MPIIIIDPNFNRLGFETSEPLEVTPKLEDKLEQSLSRILAWDYANENWKQVIVDSDGRLLVSTSPTKADENTASTASVTTTSSTVLSANPDRKNAVIQNVGTVDCYLGLGAAALTTTGLFLEAGATYIMDVWLGYVTAITASGSATLNIQEMS